MEKNSGVYSRKWYVVAGAWGKSPQNWVGLNSKNIKCLMLLSLISPRKLLKVFGERSDRIRIVL